MKFSENPQEQLFDLRNDGRLKNTESFIHHLFSVEPELAYTPDMSVEEFQEWQKAVKLKLWEVMKLPEKIETMITPKLLWIKKRDGYSLQKWEIYPEEKSVVPFLLLVPNDATETTPKPAVFCFPGSASSKELLAGEPELDPQIRSRFPVRNQMAKHYVKQGFVAIAVENPGTAELCLVQNNGAVDVAEKRTDLSAFLLNLGRSYLGLSVFQKMKILHWVKTLAFVDTEKIAVSGHSLGTEPAMVMGVLCPEIKAMVFNDFLCNTRERAFVTGAASPLWHLVPDFLQWFDFPDLLAVFAPRPLIVTEGGRTSHLNLVRNAYRAMSAETNVSINYYPKYSHSENRVYDNKEMPEKLNTEQYLEYANVDVPNHCFKENLAVPWLSEIFS